MKRKANPGFDPDPGFEKSFPGSGSGSRLNRDPGINPGIPQGPGRPQRDRLSIPGSGSGSGLSLNRDPGIESRDWDWDQE